MNRLPPVIAAIVLFVAAALGTTLPLPARAAESYGNCTGFIDMLPATISTRGTWCLRGNLDTTIISGIAIHITASSVTLDCNHFAIDALNGGPWTQAYGVHAAGQPNVSIRNCNIRGFATGIFLDGGSSGAAPGYLVERNTLLLNVRHGIWVRGAGSTIRDNRVFDTGLELAGLATVTNTYGITAWNGVDVIDNTVEAVFTPDSTEAVAYGIRTIDNGAGSVSGNRVRKLISGGPNVAVYGIYNVNSRGLVIRGNDIQGPGASVGGGVGVRCSSTPATARDNVIAGFATAIEKCMSVGNTVNTY